MQPRVPLGPGKFHVVVLVSLLKCFFVTESLLGIEGQKKLEKFAILS